MRASVSDSESKTERDSRGAPTPHRGTEAGGRNGVAERFGGESRIERGQTTLDFALGASLFLLALIGVLVFVSGTMQPFIEGSQENIGVADRVGDSLAEGLLAQQHTPHVLNAACTVAFFDDTSPSHCRHSGANLTERVGVKHWKRVNVTMQADVAGGPEKETLCWHSAGERIVEQTSSDCDTVFTAGPRPPGSTTDTVTARRFVAVDGTDVTMRVEVW